MDAAILTEICLMFPSHFQSVHDFFSHMTDSKTIYVLSNKFTEPEDDHKNLEDL